MNQSAPLAATQSGVMSLTPGPQGKTAKKRLLRNIFIHNTPVKKAHRVRNEVSRAFGHGAVVCLCLSRCDISSSVYILVGERASKQLLIQNIPLANCVGLDAETEQASQEWNNTAPSVMEGI